MRLSAAAVALLCLAALCGRAAAACAAGDLPCACAAAGGEWRNLKSPLVPTCTVKFQHQGECIVLI